MLTPSIHLSAYNADDNRFDLRPFLLNASWPYQFGKIDRHVEAILGKLEQQRSQEEEDDGEMDEAID